MVQLSIRARRELAIMHAADAIRVLAAAAIPLHLLPLGGLLLSVADVAYAWIGLFLALNAAQVVLHLTLLRAADELLKNPRRNALFAIMAGTLLLGVAVAGQVVVGGVLGVGFIVLILIVCGLFDLLCLGALCYVYVAIGRGLIGTIRDAGDRHVGFEVVLPDARVVQSDRDDRRHPATWRVHRGP